MTEPTHRVSDEDRDRALETLHASLAEGRLTMAELDQRTDLVYRAELGADLVEATGDLPAARTEPLSSPPRTARLTMGVLAHVMREGRMRIGRRSVAVNLLSDLDLDLREAEVASDRSTVTVLALMGNTDIYVPEDMDVSVGGLPVFGHLRSFGRSRPRRGAPAVHIRVLALMGTIDVWHVPAGMVGNHAKITRQLQRQQRKLGST